MTPLHSALSFAVALAIVSSSAHSYHAAQQQPARDTPSPGLATNTAAIRGRVVDAQTARPLRRVRVILTGAGLGREGLSASTDDEGRYELIEVPAGRVTVEAQRSGYLALRYGQRRPREQGKPLDLTTGQTLENIDFALPKMGVLRGRLTDELGDPIADVRVSAQRWMYVNNLRRLLPDGPIAVTDADGNYRLTGLVPGSYLVQAKTLDKWTVVAAGREITMSYAPTFFPGVTDSGQASRVDVSTGQELATIDFSLIPGRAAKLSGLALDSKGQPLRNLILAYEILGSGGGFVGIAGSGRIAADGTFEVLDVPPGSYKLQATGIDESVVLPIDVVSEDIGNIALTGSAGWSLKGEVVVESSSPAATLRRNQVAIAAVALAGPNGMGMQGGAVTRQVVNDDLTFSVTNVVGASRLRVTLPEGWAVKGILQNDRDIADTALDYSSGQEFTGVRVVVTDRVGVVAGQVVDAKTGAGADGTIVLFPADSSKWFEGSRFVRTGRPDQQGRFRIPGMLPGDYLVVALDYVEQGSWNDPGFLESLRRVAQPMTLAEGATRTMSLALVTP